MTGAAESRVDPIMVELLRSRLEAIGQEAGSAVEQTAISPIVTESKDYSVTICNAEGDLICATGVVEMHFGATLHVVKSTLATHGDTIADGDVFLANDPHNGGGLHPQDVVVHQPVFVQGRICAWVALAAHMMDMGGMVPGSSAVNATECYQEALRLPSVRIASGGEERADVWNIIRINIRSADLIEMDMRSLVVGCAVAQGKLKVLIESMGSETFSTNALALIDTTEKVLRERVRILEDGAYRTIAWVEYGEKLYRIPLTLNITGDRMVIDLTDAPPQTPHFFNSKAYIVRAVMAPRIRALLADGLPLNQAIYNVIELTTHQGTIVDCVPPAPIGSAQMDAAMAVSASVTYMLQLAIHASPYAPRRDREVAPPVAAYQTCRWTYLDEAGHRRVFTTVDGAFCGSGGGIDRDGLDLRPSLVPWGTAFEFADAEIMEATYPILFEERGLYDAAFGHGRHRSGLGCREVFGAHGTSSLVANMTGNKSWFPNPGAAGGLPGATMSLHRASRDGALIPVGIHDTGVAFQPGEMFVLECATGGGYGDPLDRDVDLVFHDLLEGRIDETTASRIYGVVLNDDKSVDPEGSEARRAARRSERLARAAAPSRPVTCTGLESESHDKPLFPGIVQRGDWAVALESGAPLARAPDNWMEGCPFIDAHLDERGGGIISRAYLDPLTGRCLHVEVGRADDMPALSVLPARFRPQPATGRLPEGINND